MDRFKEAALGAQLGVRRPGREGAGGCWNPNPHLNFCVKEAGSLPPALLPESRGETWKNIHHPSPSHSSC